MPINMISRVIRIVALIIAAIVLPVLLLLTIRFIGVVTPIIGSSMDPTLHSGQVILGLPVSANPAQAVHRGDIVTLNTHQSGKIIIKRIIALPGDTLEIRSNQIYLNGMALQEDYIAEPMRTPDIPAFTLGDDQYFVLGDNRNVSADSRYYGLFSRSDIIAVAQTQFKVLPALLFVAMIFILGIYELFMVDKLEQAWYTAVTPACAGAAISQTSMPKPL